jgi:hypothetical protein
MASDFFHRLIVIGGDSALCAFRRRAERTYRRASAGQEWPEHIPLSFVALHELTPIVASDEVPLDPLDIRAWPPVRVSPRRSELRYQFQTRNMVADPVIRRVARKFPSLTFRLMTFYLDVGEFETWQVRGRKVARRELSAARRDAHWRAGSRKFKQPVDDLYDDDDACQWVEERIGVELLDSWDRPGARRRRNWWNAPKFHALEDERTIALAAMSQMASGKKPRRRRKTRCPPVPPSHVPNGLTFNRPNGRRLR